MHQKIFFKYIAYFPFKKTHTQFYYMHHLISLFYPSTLKTYKKLIIEQNQKKQK